VLLREHGGGAQNRDLAPVQSHQKGRTQRDFGLAEADVAADQSIHDRLFLQVGKNLGDGVGLIARLLEREAGFERGVVVVGRR
jgi:hypothetical protein